jgi:hypothetical protein
MDEPTAIHCIEEKRYTEVAGHLLERKIKAEIHKMSDQEKSKKIAQIAKATEKLHLKKLAAGKGISSTAHEIADDTYLEMLEKLNIPPDVEI